MISGGSVDEHLSCSATRVSGTAWSAFSAIMTVNAVRYPSMAVSWPGTAGVRNSATRLFDKQDGYDPKGSELNGAGERQQCTERKHRDWEQSHRADQASCLKTLVAGGCNVALTMSKVASDWTAVRGDVEFISKEQLGAVHGATSHCWWSRSWV